MIRGSHKACLLIAVSLSFSLITAQNFLKTEETFYQ
jgi:hypothetical protein